METRYTVRNLDDELVENQINGQAHEQLENYVDKRIENQINGKKNSQVKSKPDTKIEIKINFCKPVKQVETQINRQKPR